VFAFSTFRWISFGSLFNTFDKEGKQQTNYVNNNNNIIRTIDSLDWSQIFYSSTYL